MKHTVRNQLPEGAFHRSDFKTCPHCDATFDNDKWDRSARILIREIVHGKHGSMAVVSECPKCFKPSWVHHSISTLHWLMREIVPKWERPVEDEYNRRKLRAIREWSASLCVQCVHVGKVVCDTSTSRSCICGFGPVHSVVDGCEKFEMHSPLKL